MPNILVTGSNGQLGSELRKLSREYSDNTYFFTDRDELDITDREAIGNFIEATGIDTIINCAAYTAVDKAEEDESNADAINHLAVKYLAQISKEKNIKLIHISTDYVFDGKNYKPYIEEDATNPQGVYGATKLAGERAMREVDPKNSVIIRTSWVYSSFGNNFVKTMLRLGKERNELGVIFDQIGTPTYARDLAEAILKILQNPEPKVNCEAREAPMGDRTSNPVEIYHYSNEGVASWYDFAMAIFEFSNIDCKVKPIETKDYPTPAARPHYSLLNKAKIKKDFNITIPYWKESLKVCLKKLGETS